MKFFEKILSFFSAETLSDMKNLIYRTMLEKSKAGSAPSDVYRRFQQTDWEERIPDFGLLKSPIRPSIDDISHYREIIDRISNKHRALVLGGTPELRDLLSEYADLSVIVADMSVKMISSCSLLLEKAESDREIWIKSDWLKLDFLNGFFDLVIGDAAILQFSPDEESLFLRGVKELLAPNGHFVTRVCVSDGQKYRDQCGADKYLGFRWWNPPARKEILDKINEVFDIKAEFVSDDYQESSRFPIFDLVSKIKDN